MSPNWRRKLSRQYFLFSMTDSSPLTQLLLRHKARFHPVVDFNPKVQRLQAMDFTSANHALTDSLVGDTKAFARYISGLVEQHDAIYGIGGYDELRTVYRRSTLFGNTDPLHSDTGDAAEPRRLHLGVDIWGKTGSPVYACLDGSVHSVAFNDHYGDYGATLITTHELEGMRFHTLHGHISLSDIAGRVTGQPIRGGECIAHFGEPAENGHWPPHLHFQVIEDLEGYSGDYPGVCRFSAREHYLWNCPDPDLILQLNQYLR